MSNTQHVQCIYIIVSSVLSWKLTHQKFTVKNAPFIYVTNLL